MTHPDQRRLHRIALLLFPDITLDPGTFDRLVEEGFTDIAIGVYPQWKGAEAFTGQGISSLEQGRDMAARAQEKDLGVVLFTAYQKYQENQLKDHPEREMILSATDAQVDSDYSTAASHWLCPFQPVNRRNYVDFLKKVVLWPEVREIHLNDEAGIGSKKTIACYCDYCRERFEALSGSPPPEEMDVDSALWWEWIQARFAWWSEVHAEFRDVVKELCPDVSVGIQHSPVMPTFTLNPWKSGVSLGRDARTLDCLCTDPYQFIHGQLSAFRPHRRGVSDTTRSLVGACVDKSVTIYTQGFMPPGQSTPLSRQDGLLSGVLPFALGAEAVLPYAYELAKIIPGWFEGFEDTRRLLPFLEKHRPYAFATVIKPEQSEIYGHHTQDWGAWYLTETANVMYRTGLPWRWFYDIRLQDAADRLTGPLVVPDAHCLTGGQIHAIRRAAERGGGILWIGNMPMDPWDGESYCPPPSSQERADIFLEHAADIPVLEGLSDPVVLQTSVSWDGPAGSGPAGDTAASVGDRPGLVLWETDSYREAWLSGIPQHSYVAPGSHSSLRTQTAGIELFRRLIKWVARREPIVCLDPFPPPNDYGRLRPWDKRDVPTVELLPMTAGRSLLGVVFPYTPLACSTNLVIRPPGGKRIESVRDVWSGDDLMESSRYDDENRQIIPLEIRGDTELMAIEAAW